MLRLRSSDTCCSLALFHLLLSNLFALLPTRECCPNPVASRPLYEPPVTARAIPNRHLPGGCVCVCARVHAPSGQLPVPSALRASGRQGNAWIASTVSVCSPRIGAAGKQAHWRLRGDQVQARATRPRQPPVRPLRAQPVHLGAFRSAAAWTRARLQPTRAQKEPSECGQLLKIHCQ